MHDNRWWGGEFIGSLVSLKELCLQPTWLGVGVAFFPPLWPHKLTSGLNIIVFSGNKCRMYRKGYTGEVQVGY